jgi:hypothetical protein
LQIKGDSNKKKLRVFFSCFSWGNINVKELMDTLSYGGFHKMALKNSIFGISEMIKSAFITLQLPGIKKFIPEITADDLSR